MSNHAKPLAGPCPNCGTVLTAQDHFCRQCGQKNEPLRLPLSHLLEELVEGIWHFDSKTWTTIKALFLKPGQITVDFLEGRRMRYVPPLRLYIFVSALFFLTVNLLVHHINEHGDADVEATQRDRELGRTRMNTSLADTKSQEGKARIRQDSVLIGAKISTIRQGFRGLPLSAEDAKALAGAGPRQRSQAIGDSLMARMHRIPGVQAALQADPEVAAYLDSLVHGKSYTTLLSSAGAASKAYWVEVAHTVPLDSARLDSILHRGPAIQQAFMQRHGRTNTFKQGVLISRARGYERVLLGQTTLLGDQNTQHAIIKAVSVVMFLLMPLVGLLLFGLFFRRRNYYTEHLIHAIHLHVWAFLAIMILFTIPSYFGAGNDAVGWITSILLMAGLPLYTLLSIKRVYGQGWGRTLWKFLVSLVVYLLIAGVLMTLASVYGMIAT